MASISSSSELLNEEIEIQSLQKSFAKSSKKSNYGSMRKDEPQAIAPIINYKHMIKSGETLQGISLKYNVPIENIKRANRLWSNDLAFIKEVLIVPIRKDKFEELKINYPDLENNDINLDSINQDKSANKKKDVELADYLTKFDCLINESKIRLKNLETSSKLSQKTKIDQNGFTFPSENINKYDALKNNKSSLNKSNKGYHSDLDDASSVNRLENSLTSMPDCLIADPVSSNDTSASSNSSYLNGGGGYGGSRAKLAHRNLLRLEREKDELFEL